MTLCVIAAVSQNGVIGRDGDLPWHLSADLKRFKRLTIGHHLIMGRKTFESIGRPLPGRTSIVVTRQANYTAPKSLIAHNPETAVRMASGDDCIFVVGGAELYRWALPRADRLYLTRVEATVDGDTYFPPLDLRDWKLVEESQHSADDKNPHDYSFCVYERIG